jgi:hypothetical protein
MITDDTQEPPNLAVSMAMVYGETTTIGLRVTTNSTLAVLSR